MRPKAGDRRSLVRLILVGALVLSVVVLGPLAWSAGGVWQSAFLFAVVALGLPLIIMWGNSMQADKYALLSEDDEDPHQTG